MKMKKVISAAFAAMMLPSISIAGGGFVAGVEVAGGGGDVKDLGNAYGLDVGYYANNNLRLRLGYTSIDFENNKTVGSVSFVETFDQGNTRLTMDWFPWSRSNGFFVSAGATKIGDPSSLSMQVDTNLIYPLNGSFYTGTQLGNISGSIETKSVVPYVGLGYRYQFRERRGWFVQAEVGEIFGLSPTLKLSSDNTSLATLNSDLQVYADSQNELLEDSYTVYGAMIGYLF